MRSLIVDIFWFSGTGNTFLVAKEVKKALEAAQQVVVMHPLEQASPIDIKTEHAIGLIFPVTHQGTHRFIWQFVENMPRTDFSTEIFMIDTRMIYSGGIKGPMRNILTAKGYVPIGACEITMPSNLFRKISSPKSDILKRERGLKKARDFIRQMMKNETAWRDIPFLSDWLSRRSRDDAYCERFTNRFKFSINPQQCVRCGLCHRICPMENIQFDKESGDTPIIGDHCTCCLRCFSYCPEHAIRMGSEEFEPYKAIEDIDEMIEPQPS
ncbi:MAG: hypothetical protein EOL87_08645 [Spartobacteria bacterium]|nr:hypothetical protein [Spartobacteria bacterium]